MMDRQDGSSVSVSRWRSTLLVHMRMLFLFERAAAGQRQRPPALAARRPGASSGSLCLLLLLLVVRNGRLNGLLRQDGAVDLHRRELEVRGDVCVLQLLGVVHGLADDHLRGEGAARDGGAAAEGLELRVLDDAVLDLHLQLDHVTARSLAHERCANGGLALVQGAHVPRIVEVVVHGLVVGPHASGQRRRTGAESAAGRG
mmetsp:Transcript_59966/g.144902  ORF Transcript_59966/g.144902 Transcript_59966/m.144902 type:complete len:201 (-) Transcript_59966:77-679(-)